MNDTMSRPGALLPMLPSTVFFNFLGNLELGLNLLYDSIFSDPSTTPFLLEKRKMSQQKALEAPFNK